MDKSVTTRIGISGWVVFSVLAARAETFTDTGAPIEGTRLCSVAWGDYDNDGDLDLLYAGGTAVPPNRTAAVARNDAGVFTQTDVGLPGATYASVVWGDYDGDADLDIAISGNSTQRITQVYGNEGGGVFSLVEDAMPGHYSCSLAWGDHDQDGDVDLALAGFSTSFVCTVFRNEGDGHFNDVEAGMEGIYRCSLAWGDYDSDGDLDILVAGQTGGAGDYLTRIYSNTAGVFEDALAGLVGVGHGAVGWADYDCDGDLDLALCGRDVPVAPGSKVSKVYENVLGTFQLKADLTGVSGWFTGASLAWGDFDADGDPDLVMAGEDGSSLRTIVYRNDAGTFNVEQELEGVRDCSVAWGDYDDDGDLDLVVAGQSESTYVTLIYRCNVNQPNSAPSAPGAPAELVDEQDVTLSWTASTDTETPQPVLTYNLRVGTALGLDDVMCSMSDPATGRRLVPAAGNARENLSWTLLQLPQAVYWWAVQAVDGGFAASGWTEGSSFQIFDTTPPTVLSSDPTDGETQVPTSTLIRVTFSEPMNKPAVEAALSVSPGATGDFAWNGNTLIFTASPVLSENTGYTVSVGTGALDLADNALQTEFSFWFKTPDETPPTVVSTSPVDTATDVDPSEPMVITFSEEMNQVITRAAFSIDDPSVTPTFSWDGPAMSVLALGGLDDETAYIVTIATTAEDASGMTLEIEYVFSFTTGEYTPPSPPGGFAAAALDTVSISLSWALPGEPDFLGVVILRSDSGPPSYAPSRGEVLTVANTYGNAVCIYSGVGTSLDDSGLSPSTRYYYAAYSFDDKHNYSPAAFADTETAVVEFPQVVSTVPPDGAGKAAPETTVEITFSKPMNQPVTESAFSISPAVTGAFSWNGETLVFTPDDPLLIDQAYTVTVSTGAKALDGYGLVAEFGFSFTVSEGGGGGCGGCGVQAALVVIIALFLRRRS